MNRTQRIEEKRRQVQESKPKIVCLCGSTRFTEQMLYLEWEMAKKGIITLGWCWLPSNHTGDGTEIEHHLAEKEGIVDILDALHLRKIDLADEIMVVNVGGYIGERTRREIQYARSKGKMVTYLERVK